MFSALILFIIGLALASFWVWRKLPVAGGGRIKSTYNIVYCTGGGQDLKMDTYTPLDGSKALKPVVIFIHGGGWRTGDKLAIDLLPEKAVLIERGYFVAAINYRLAPENKWPAFMEDAKCAVRHIRANAASYGIDPNRIAVFGASAGAHIALMLGLAGPEAGLEGNGGYAGVSSQVKAVVSYFGPTDLTQSYFFHNQNDDPMPRVFGYRTGDPAAIPTLQQASPISYVGPQSPAIAFFHGDKDSTVPWSESQNLFNALEKVGVPTEFRLVKNAAHGLIPSPITADMSPARKAVADAMANFLDQHDREALIVNQ